MYFTLLLICLGFILDLIIHATLGYPAFSIMKVAFYACAITNFNFLILAVLALPLLFESFIYCGNIGVDLVFMIPGCLALYSISKIVHFHFILQIIALMTCVSLHSFIINYGLLGQPIKCFNNMPIIFLNFAVGIIMLYYIRGSRGNRSN